MDKRIETVLARAGTDADAQHGAVMPPIHLSSTFAFEGLDRKRRYDYTRSGNPTRDILADALTTLEGGAGCVVTSSGMSAIATMLNLVGPGDLVLASNDTYGGTRRLLDALAAKGSLQLQLLDPTSASAWARGLAESPRLVWIETPSNPLLRATDIRAVVAGARKAGSLVVVDNTFLTPLRQRPLALGADVVVHSTTKYLNGHSDVVGGAIVSGTEQLAEQLAWWANATGVTGAPFDSWLTMRGLRTLPARLRIHEANALRIAQVLDAHPAVARVYYPGLESHADHKLATAQADGFGAIVSFELVGGRSAARAVAEGLRCFSLAESLGGIESLVAHPATMTHGCMNPEDRQAAGITDGLLRLSVGIESVDDLIADLRRGLRAVGPSHVVLAPA